MHPKIRLSAGLVIVTAASLVGCSSSDTTTEAESTSTAAESTTAEEAAGGPPSGGAMQEITEVDLNTDGSSPGGANTAEVADAANAFLATLDDSVRSEVQYEFSNNLARQTWSNYPATQVPREGVSMDSLTDEQRDAAQTMLQAALSDAGQEQDENIRAADDYLNSLGGDGADGFGSMIDYFVAVYGEPSENEPFMVQFGGHHLARNLTYNGDNVSQTPQFVGSEPPSFEVDGTTVEPVKAESDGMFGALASLTDEQRTSAEITSGTFDDLLMGPGKDTGNFPDAEGLESSTLDETQRAAIMTAIEAYVGDIDDEAAAALMAKYEAELDDTRIGWANATGPTDESSYIRIDGPSVWIEFINTRSRSTPDIHYHSVYRDKTNDYGSSTPS